MTTETLTLTSARYAHTIPTGETVTFEVSPSRWSERCILVEYPAGVDLSPYQARDAYPIEQIEGDWGTFVFCDAYGTDGGTSWEVWRIAR